MVSNNPKHLLISIITQTEFTKKEAFAVLRNKKITQHKAMFLLSLFSTFFAAHLAVNVEDLIGKFLSASRTDETVAMKRFASKNDEIIIEFLATSRADLIVVRVLGGCICLLLFLLLGCRGLGLFIATTGARLTAVEFAALALIAGAANWPTTSVTSEALLVVNVAHCTDLRLGADERSLALCTEFIAHTRLLFLLLLLSSRLHAILTEKIALGVFAVLTASKQSTALGAGEAVHVNSCTRIALHLDHAELATTSLAADLALVARLFHLWLWWRSSALLCTSLGSGNVTGQTLLLATESSIRIIRIRHTNVVLLRLRSVQRTKSANALGSSRIGIQMTIQTCLLTCFFRSQRTHL